MVGVPGKSKGCSTCRRRKKGCDQKRPICGQCSASGYTCGGYQRDLTFVLHPASKAVEKAIFLPTKPRPSLLANSQSLQRSAIILQCQDLFYDVYLPHGRCVVTDQFILKCGRPGNWTHVMQNFTFNDISLELAFTAFSMSRVGRKKDDPRLIKESTKFYGKALKNLQKALYDPSRMHSEQVLTACLLLGLYETFEGAGGKSVGWVSHAQGAARIVELRGPERHTELPAHTLFLGTRLPIIYSAILRRKKTFLSDSSWLTVPWRRQKKSGLDRLIDIATHVPGILEQFDSVRSQMSTAGQIHALQSCLTYCHQLQRSLSTWNTIRRPNSEAIAREYECTDPTDTYPFTQELTYENHLFLNANLIHWSSALVIANTVCEIEFLLASFGYQSTSMMSSTAAAIQEAQDCASKIAQSIPYCLWHDMGDIGIDYVQFPMRLAFQFFMKSNNSKVCTWMIEKAKQLQKDGPSTSSAIERRPIPFDIHDTGYSIFDTPVSTTETAFGQVQSAPSGAAMFAPSMCSQENAGPSVPSSRNSGVKGTVRHNIQDKLLPDVVSLSATATNPDFDADYDLESDQEIPSSLSENSTSPADTSSKYGYGHRSSGSPALNQPCNSSMVASEYAFVQENPSQYYIDRSEVY